MGWAHQTYWEFLTAHYLVTRNLPIKTVVSLITHPEATRKIVPQLQEVAGWLASMMPEYFRAFVDIAPEVLLTSDAASADPGMRRALTQNLLAAADRGDFFDNDWGVSWHFRKLGYQATAQDLSPFITDERKGIVPRRIAIDIAEVVRCTDVIEELLGVALASSENLEIRRQAAFAVSDRRRRNQGEAEATFAGIARSRPRRRTEGFGVTGALA